MENEQSTCITFYSNESKAEYSWHLVMLFREMVADAASTLQKGRTTVCENFRNILGGKYAGSKMKLYIIHSCSKTSLVKKKKKKYKVEIQGYL